MRSDEQITSIIEAAFRPLRCGAEIWDYRRKVRFRVFDPNDRPIVGMRQLALNHARSDSFLCDAITQVRERVEARGLPLEPWRLQVPS